MEDRVLSPRQVCDYTGLGRTTIWRATKSGAFPAPIRLSPNRIGWSRRAVETWLEANTTSRAREAA
jgi:prophage regulatory protein